MKQPVFVAALNCMDGRAQLPVIRYLKRKYKAAYVDMITEPGIVRMVGNRRLFGASASIKKRLNISIHKHQSRKVALVAHHDCSGNPVSAQVQKKQLKEGVLNIKAWNSKPDVVGLWLGPDWKVQEIT